MKQKEERRIGSESGKTEGIDPLLLYKPDIMRV
jgi:hypothetical protein